MVLVAAGAIVPKVQVSTPVVIEQAAASGPPTVQVPDGRVSWSVTLVELPVPPAVTTTVKVAVPPALTAALPVLRTPTSGWQTTATVALAVAPPGVSVAVFVTLGHALAVAVTLIVITADAPAARVPILQVTVWLETEQFVGAPPFTLKDGVPVIVSPAGTGSDTDTPV